MKLGLMRTCFGCCELRTGVMIVAIIDLLIGMYDIIEFCVRVYLDVSISLHQKVGVNSTYTPLPYVPTTAPNITGPHNMTEAVLYRPHGALYDDSAFAVIVVGCIDMFISAFLLYVATLRKYDLRVVVFIAAIWSFIFAFLDIVSFAVFVSLHMLLDMVYFLFASLLQLFFGYVVLSYFKLMTIVVERGLDDIHMSYFPEEPISASTEVQMDEANDERPIMDDQDDFPAYEDDKQNLVTT